MESMNPVNGSKDYLGRQSGHSWCYSYIRTAHVHGLKYLKSKERFERIFWLIVLLICFSLALIFVMEANGILNMESHYNSVSRPEPIHNIPFPAITICPETKAKKSIVDVSDAYHAVIFNNSIGLSDETKLHIEALSHVCDPHLFDSVKLQNEPTSGKKFYEILRNISIDQNGTLLACKYRNEMNSCDSMFRETVTNDGICWTFNMFKSNEMFSENEVRHLESRERDIKSSWQIDSGYDSTDYNVYPNRAFYGSNVGLNVLLMLQKTDLDHICRGPVQGFKIHLHSPDNFPHLTSSYYRVPIRRETIIKVKPKVSSNLVNSGTYCHTCKTKKMKYFNKYSQSNCQAECLSNFVLSKCGCVMFSMVHARDTQICHQHDTACITNASSEFSLSHRLKENFPCDCKPSCHHLNYEAEVSQAIFDFEQVFSAFKENESELNVPVLSRLVVYFDNDYFMSTTTYRMDSEFTLIAKCGGILAFFLGASFISFIELFYHLFRRFIY